MLEMSEREGTDEAVVNICRYCLREFVPTMNHQWFCSGACVYLCMTER